MLLTTHYMEEAEILCDRLAIMDHGQILEMGTVEELVSKRFQERAVQFDSLEAVAGCRARRAARRDASSSTMPAMSLLYTRDVAATIGALLALAESRGLEPQNLAHPPGDPRGRLPRPDRPGAA